MPTHDDYALTRDYIRENYDEAVNLLTELMWLGPPPSLMKTLRAIMADTHSPISSIQEAIAQVLPRLERLEVATRIAVTRRLWDRVHRTNNLTSNEGAAHTYINGIHQ